MAHSDAREWKDVFPNAQRGAHQAHHRGDVHGYEAGSCLKETKTHNTLQDVHAPWYLVQMFVPET